MKRKNKCVASKKAYGTTDACFRVMKRVYKQRKVKLLFYECPVCLDFHLTHKGSDFELNKYYKLWRDENKKKDSKQIIAKQYREFQILFNRLTKEIYGTSKKKKTILKGILPRADRLRILAEMSERRRQAEVTSENPTICHN